MNQTIHLHNRSHRSMPAQPITYGLPWERGAVRRIEALRALDERGQPIPAAFTSLNTWPDGSIQWSLVDLNMDFGPSGDRAVTIACTPCNRRGGPSPIRRPRHPVKARLARQSARIGNGLVDLTVSAKPGELITRWSVGRRDLVVPGGFDVTFADPAGQRWSLTAGPRQLSLEHVNPLRAVLRIDGKHGLAPGGANAAGRGTSEPTAWLDYFLRIEVRADRDDVKVTYSFRNRELATPGITVCAWEARLGTAVPAQAKRCFTANTRTRHYLTQPMRVAEDPVIVASDTGDLDHYPQSHQERANADCFVRNPEVLHDPLEEKPWWLRDVKFRRIAGGSSCVWPYLAILSRQGGALVSMAGMTCLHPKDLTVTGSTFRLGIWPDWAGELPITQGAGRSIVLHVAPLPGNITDTQIQDKYLSWEFGGIHTHVPSASPVEIVPDLDQVRRSEVFAIHRLPPYEPRRNFSFERKVLDAWIGISYGQLGAVDKVQPWPPAGFWHYGDHGLGNNEEMHNLVHFQNYLRSGTWDCAEYALAGTTHMMEVDHCAFSTDHLQTGGQVSHTTNHNNGTAYPSHEWFTEYLFAYALTGDREFLETARRACEHLLHWINLDEGFQIIAADQREAGQPMINLTWCHPFTKDTRYLDGCRKIVRDCLMANTRKYGRMLDGKPPAHPVKICSYGDYAAWEGMYWLWEITQDDELRQFMLSQLEWRLTWEHMGVHGFHRVTDYNPAAYAYYMTGDVSWIERVARPFRAAFRAARWPLGWVHAMYYIKLALERGIVTDDDVLVQ